MGAEFYVYRLTWENRPEFYVGVTKDPKQRFRAHKSGQQNSLIAAMIDAYGEPILEVLEEVSGNACYLTREAAWIAKLNACNYKVGGLNKNIGGSYLAQATAEWHRTLVINPMPPEKFLQAVATRNDLLAHLLDTSDLLCRIIGEIKQLPASAVRTLALNAIKTWGQQLSENAAEQLEKDECA